MSELDPYPRPVPVTMTDLLLLFGELRKRDMAIADLQQRHEQLVGVVRDVVAAWQTYRRTTSLWQMHKLREALPPAVRP